MPAIREGLSRVNNDFMMGYLPKTESFNEQEYEEYIQLSKPTPNPNLLSLYGEAS
jgi:hypothetical protein